MLRSFRQLGLVAVGVMLGGLFVWLKLVRDAVDQMFFGLTLLTLYLLVEAAFHVAGQELERKRGDRQ